MCNKYINGAVFQMRAVHQIFGLISHCNAPPRSVDRVVLFIFCNTTSLISIMSLMHLIRDKKLISYSPKLEIVTKKTVKKVIHSNIISRKSMC